MPRLPLKGEIVTIFAAGIRAWRVAGRMAMKFLPRSGLGRERAPGSGVALNGRLRMRRLAFVGAMMAGLVLAGCSGQGDALDDGWKLIAAQDYAAARVQY